MIKTLGQTTASQLAHLDQIMDLEVEIAGDEDTRNAVALPHNADNRHVPAVNHAHVYLANDRETALFYVLVFQLDWWKHLSLVVADARDPSAAFVVHTTVRSQLQAVKPVRGFAYSWTCLPGGIWACTQPSGYSLEGFHKKKLTVEHIPFGEPSVGSRRWTTN